MVLAQEDGGHSMGIRRQGPEFGPTRGIALGPGPVGPGRVLEVPGQPAALVGGHILYPSLFSGSPWSALISIGSIHLLGTPS